MQASAPNPNKFSFYELSIEMKRKIQHLNRAAEKSPAEANVDSALESLCWHGLGGTRAFPSTISGLEAALGSLPREIFGNFVQELCPQAGAEGQARPSGVGNRFCREFPKPE